MILDAVIYNVRDNGIVTTKKAAYVAISTDAVLFGHPVGKKQGHLCMNYAPILPPSRLLFRDIHHCQIQHFKQDVIRRKNGFRLGHLAKLPVKALNGLVL